MNVLGISCFFHDSAAVILKNGKLISAAQEERFTRIKHDPSFPKNAIHYCLKEASLSIDEIDKIIFYEDPELKFKRIRKSYINYFPKSISLFFKTFLSWFFVKRNITRRLQKLFESNFSKKLEKRIFEKIEHHRSHAASAFFPSPFEESAVLIMDGVGEFATTSIWYGNKNKLKKIKQIDFPNSIGLLYSAFTYYLGFKVNSGEYKMMGLAPYGTPKYVKLIKDNLIEIFDDGTFKIDMSFFSYHYSDFMTNNKFHKLFEGEPRIPESKITQKEMDLAKSIQLVVEEIILKLSKFSLKKCNTSNLCIAGGVGLNCVANGKIFNQITKNIWIQPASGDAGGALGAAFDYYFSKLNNPLVKDNFNDLMRGAYLGPSYTEREVISELQEYNPNYERLDDEQLSERIASEIQNGNVVGWFQGRAEFGPRALGNRSILGDPRNPEMQKTMNLKIKFRESFRPFAPVTIEEDVSSYFDGLEKSPYMLLVSNINENVKIKLTENKLNGFEKLNLIRSKLPAITHVDNSARIQTINKKSNLKLYNLINSFKDKTGTSVLINTSFNVRGEPIVNSPKDAYRCFMSSNIDILVIGNFVYFKSEQKNSKSFSNYTYELD